jgi:hypothetical protein
MLRSPFSGENIATGMTTMKSASVFIAALLLAGLGFYSSAAEAAFITYDVTFSATDFYPVPAAPRPSTVMGEFHITVDAAGGSVLGGTSGVSLDSINIALDDSALVFDYQPSLDRLTVSGAVNGLATSAMTNDFQVFITGFASGAPTLSDAFFVDSTSRGLFESSSGTVTVTAVAATPIPAALPLFVSALGGLGLVGWRRKRRAAIDA